MDKLDDIELIRKFVQGELNLIANPNLRIEPAFNTAQLLAKRGGLLATAQLVNQIRSVMVRQSSTYQELLNRILVEHRFIPTRINAKGFVEYEPLPIPTGYDLNYTEVRQLWKAWRTHYSHRTKRSQVLVKTAKGWEAVQAIEFGAENFFIKTASDELMLCSSDRLVWLSPTEDQGEETKVIGYPSGHQARVNRSVSEAAINSSADTQEYCDWYTR